MKKIKFRLMAGIFSIRVQNAVKNMFERKVGEFVYENDGSYCFLGSDFSMFLILRQYLDF